MIVRPRQSPSLFSESQLTPGGHEWQRIPRQSLQVEDPAVFSFCRSAVVLRFIEHHYPEATNFRRRLRIPESAAIVTTGRSATRPSIRCAFTLETTSLRISGVIARLHRLTS